MSRILIAALALLLALPASPGRAQELGLSGEGPIEILADGSIEWRRNEQVVIASGNARAIRAGTTVFADRLIARYRDRAGAQPNTQAGATPTGAGEIWRLEADGNVRIVSNTDRAEGDRAVYDLDRRVLVMTGRALSLTNGDDRVTARDALEYWVDRRMAVARGDASVLTQDRRLDAETVVAYFREAEAAGAPARAQPAPSPSLAPGTGRLDRVEAFGDVRIRTATEFLRGDRGIYTPETGIARVAGNVRITRGQNQLNGEVAETNLNTGVSRLIAGPGGRVAGMIVPQERDQPAPAALAPPPAPAPRAPTPRPAPRPNAGTR